MRTTLPIVVMLALAGCGGDGAERDTSGDPTLPATPGAAPSSSAAPEPERSSRGNLIKTLGQEAGFCSDADCTGPLAVTFTIDTITVDPACTSGYPEPAENGHLIAVSLRVATAADMPRDMFAMFSPSEFRVIGPDGLTVSALDALPAFSCLDQSEVFPMEPLGPGQQYAGAVVIDSPTPTGTLVYQPGAAAAGWEWQF